MKISRIFFGILLVLGLGVSAVAQVKMSSEAVDALVKKYNQVEVDFNYVMEKVGDGTKKGAKAIILDARPEAKYNKSHIPTALPMPDTTYKKYLHYLDGKSQKDEIIIYCGGPKCHKSPELGNILKKLGYSNIKIYRGGSPEWKKKAYMDIGLDYAYSLYQKNQALFIDARPGAKFRKSSVIGALSLPDTLFDKMWGRLPIDTRTPVVTFCGGYECHKSHVVAKKMVAMGYTNVMTLSAGLPAWKKANYETTNSMGIAPKKATGPKMAGPVKLGGDPGTVDVAWFKKMLENKPDDITIVDLRAAESHAKGHLNGCTNIPRGRGAIQPFMDKLPKSGYIIMACATGNTAASTYEELKANNYPRMNNIFYLDAKIECKAVGDCQIEGYDLVDLSDLM